MRFSIQFFFFQLFDFFILRVQSQCILIFFFLIKFHYYLSSYSLIITTSMCFRFRSKSEIEKIHPNTFLSSSLIAFNSTNVHHRDLAALNRGWRRWNFVSILATIQAFYVITDNFKRDKKKEKKEEKMRNCVKCKSRDPTFRPYMRYNKIALFFF